MYCTIMVAMVPRGETMTKSERLDAGSFKTNIKTARAMIRKADVVYVYVSISDDCGTDFQVSKASALRALDYDDDIVIGIVTDGFGKLTIDASPTW